jgi:hypothetical protein
MIVSRLDHCIGHFTEIEIATGGVTRRVKTKSPPLVPNEDSETDSAVGSHRGTPVISRHGETGTGFSEELDITV